MTKTIPEIDDETLDRAYEAYRAAYSPLGHAREMIRAALTAALTPEPEIEVTEGMRKVGAEEIKSLGATNHRAIRDGLHLDTYPIETYDAALIYKKMESTRLKEAAYAAFRRTALE